MDSTLSLLFGSITLAGLAPAIRRRWLLSRAKHPSLGGHSRMARRVARLLPGYAYDETEFFDRDGAPPALVAQRRQAMQALSETLQQRHARTIAMTREAREGISDLQFTSRYRVPYQFSPLVQQWLPIGAFWSSSNGVTLTDLDGRSFYDLAGSYGVNLLGYDAYKDLMAEGLRRTQDLGPVLGGYHPVVVDNVRRLRQVSGQEEVSFHMSGTEAVMQAVRLARYHTRRSHVVRFCGAYHGWWDDVQPGPGNPQAPGQVYTLADMSERSLAALRSRRDVACVLVNPLQALHPNAAAAGDSSLIDSSRRAGFDRAAYTAWLKSLRALCTERGIVLVLDEVFLGFRLAPGGAQEYFGVQADLVTYGKTLGGGWPIGVVCGPHRLMRRYREDRPADVCFARGTFNAHPGVMGAMSAFLEHLDRPQTRALYEGLDERQDARAALLNAELARHDLPVEVKNLSTVWTVNYTRPSRYNWLLQYYLREQGIALSWVGTGRMIFSLNWHDGDFGDFVQRFVSAAQAMRSAGWWWGDAAQSNRDIRRGLLREMLARR
ncbi:MAG: aminotransferase class III-fold pyridoxal phosphate-dependent enzyme [Burkholderiales bacterium]|nr:aminotransferase class III-fold pyridoxal phosphate-dependent enzyme [Burkholderiales bacterium]